MNGMKSLWLSAPQKVHLLEAASGALQKRPELERMSNLYTAFVFKGRSEEYLKPKACTQSALKRTEDNALWRVLHTRLRLRVIASYPTVRRASAAKNLKRVFCGFGSRQIHKTPAKIFYISGF